MPPLSALHSLTKLIQCQIDYLLTSWNHSAELPDFMAYGCFTKTEAGELLYDMGPETHTEDRQNLIAIPEDELLSCVAKAKVTRKRKQKPEYIENEEVDIVDSDLDDIENMLENISDIENEIDEIPFMEMSVDDDSALINQTDTTQDYSVEIGRQNISDKRPLDETPGKEQQCSKRQSRISTPK